MDSTKRKRTNSKRLSLHGEVRDQPSVIPRSLLTEAPDIDLTTLVPTLDAAASDLVAHQRDSLVQRKDLAQKTKDFRKLDDPAKLNEIKTLLKGTLFSDNALDELVL